MPFDCCDEYRDQRQSDGEHERDGDHGFVDWHEGRLLSGDCRSGERIGDKDDHRQWQGDQDGQPQSSEPDAATRLPTDLSRFGGRVRLSGAAFEDEPACQEQCGGTAEVAIEL